MNGNNFNFVIWIGKILTWGWYFKREPEKNEHFIAKLLETVSLHARTRHTHTDSHAYTETNDNNWLAELRVWWKWIGLCKRRSTTMFNVQRKCYRYRILFAHHTYHFQRSALGSNTAAQLKMFSVLATVVISFHCYFFGFALHSFCFTN